MSYSDSCQRGWRLLYILTAFHRCSEVLKPFLVKYLQQAFRSAGAQYQGKGCTGNKISRCRGAELSPQTLNYTVIFCLNVSGIAKACEQNLKKTFQYGGRLVPPNSMELKAMMVSGLLLCSDLQTNGSNASEKVGAEAAKGWKVSGIIRDGRKSLMKQMVLISNFFSESENNHMGKSSLSVKSCIYKV